MAMQPISPRDDRSKELMSRLNRATSQINPFLLAAAFGLVVLYLTCLLALVIRLPITFQNACLDTSAPSLVSSVQAR
jgi:hypothetical protein